MLKHDPSSSLYHELLSCRRASAVRSLTLLHPSEIMRQPHQSSLRPPPSQDPGTDQPIRHASNEPMLRHASGSNDSSLTSPWSAAGLPEPGWWRAFVVDRNVVSTRTPVLAHQDRSGANGTNRDPPRLPPPRQPVPSQPPAAESSIQRRIDQLLSAFSPPPTKEAPSPVQPPPSRPKPLEGGSIEITDIQEAPVHMAKPAPNIDAASVDHVAPSVTPRAAESLDESLECLRPALSAQTGSVSFSWQPLRRCDNGSRNISWARVC